MRSCSVDYHVCELVMLLEYVVASDLLIMSSCVVFFFKQKTAYEMRISDWSSDVCSSDLIVERHREVIARRRILARENDVALCRRIGDLRARPLVEIGRASCRERVCQYV